MEPFLKPRETTRRNHHSPTYSDCPYHDFLRTASLLLFEFEVSVAIRFETLAQPLRTFFIQGQELSAMMHFFNGSSLAVFVTLGIVVSQALKDLGIHISIQV